MIDTTFEQLESTFEQGGAEAMFAALAEHLRSERRLHELFDLRLTQARHRAGLPLVAAKSIDDLADPLRSRMEQAYLEACREVGGLLLEKGQLREAWMYLRPVGDKAAMRAALERLSADEQQGLYETMIELAVYEGIAPAFGFQLVLKQYGLCNAISMFDAEMQNRSRAEKQEIAGLLVRFIHGELLESLKRDIERQQGQPPHETTIAELVADRDWLFAADNYHVDTSHLNSVVRFALLVDDPEVLRLAIDLTEYGRRLSPQFQFAGEAPFGDPFPTSAMFFRGLLGEQTEEALAWFKAQAEERPVTEAGSGPAEVYIGLLARLGRYDEAIRALAQLLPPESRGGHFAPNLLELAQLGGRYDALREVCRERGDLIGFVVGLLEGASDAAGKPAG
ncbi:MAG TPA: hypothetical protein VHZ24_05355 [Pirellulales bacterium]|jgi:tetratricopeptide (TPR) repeat protein|nr:hypothetical protein [Pirellulales bacterium]